MYVIGSRVMFAQTFDRIFPEKLAHIETRFVSPINAMAVYVVLFVYYYAVRAYRKKFQGIDLDLAFKEVPPD